MSHFSKLPEFESEFKKLSKKYRSLEQDIKDLESVLLELPVGIGKNFTIIYDRSEIKIVKVRLACKSLLGRSMRLIYAYNNNIVTFVYIELYFKGDKENEDRKRIEQYLKSVSNN